MCHAALTLPTFKDHREPMILSTTFVSNVVGQLLTTHEVISWRRIALTAIYIRLVHNYRAFFFKLILEIEIIKT